MGTLIIFTIAGSTFSFKNVDDFNLGSDHISFSYSGQLTGRRNRATFYHISMVGYSWLGELEKEPEDKSTYLDKTPQEYSKKLLRENFDMNDVEYFKSLGQIL